MEFVECVKGRRSIRKFTNEKIPHKTFEKIVEMASYSPSWKNTQTVRYTFIENKEMLDKIADECISGFEFNIKTIKNAPAIILITSVKGLCGYEKDGTFTTKKGDRWESFDAGIATQTLCLSAYSQGLGTVILGIFDEDKLKETVSVPENENVAAIVAIGYPLADSVMPKRKAVDEITRYI